MIAGGALVAHQADNNKTKVLWQSEKWAELEGGGKNFFLRQL